MHSRNKQTIFKYEKVLMINPSEGSPGYIQVISLVRQSRNISKLLEVCLPQIW